jgi:hypothetical protein
MSLYPVDMPDWLPDDVVEQMVERFEYLFLDDLQLALKLKELNRSRKRTLSIHSYMSMQRGGEWEAPGANSDLMTFDPPSDSE